MTDYDQAAPEDDAEPDEPSNEAGKWFRRITQLAVCRLITGNDNAAIVLYYLKMRQPNRSIGEKHYIVRSTGDIGIDNAMSLRKVDRALAKLRKLGFIKSEQHLWRGLTVNHFQLTQKFVVEFAKMQKNPKAALAELFNMND